MLQSALGKRNTSDDKFNDMGARDAYASMIPCITKGIAKEGKAHQIRDFAHRYNPAQTEPCDGISARCAGVHSCDRA